MGNLSSGNFKLRQNNIQEEHNDRTLEPSYLLPKEFRGKNEVNYTSKEARELKEQIIKNAINTYENTYRQPFKSKSYEWSLVVNLKATSTMNDLKKLAQHFQKKYKFQCYQIAIHRDEGHIDKDTNKAVLNHHAHMEFITLDKDTGKNIMRKAHLTAKHFREIQTEIAQILGMKRGIDKRISKAKRIEPRELGAIAEEKINKRDRVISKQQDKINKLKKEIERPSMLNIVKDKIVDSTQNKNKVKELEKELEAKNAEINTAIEMAFLNGMEENTLIGRVERLKDIIKVSAESHVKLENKSKESIEYYREYIENLSKHYGKIEELVLGYRQTYGFNTNYTLEKNANQLEQKVKNILEKNNENNELRKSYNQKEQELEKLKTSESFQKSLNKETLEGFNRIEKLLFGEPKTWGYVAKGDADRIENEIKKLVSVQNDSSYTALNNELNALKTQNKTLQEQNTDLQKQLTPYKSLQTELAIKDSTINNLQEQNNKLKTQNTNLQQELTEKTNLLEKFYSILKSIFRAFFKLEPQTEELFTKKPQNETLKLFEELPTTAKETQLKLEKLEQENQEQQETIRRQARKIDDLTPSYGKRL